MIWHVKTLFFVRDPFLRIASDGTFTVIALQYWLFIVGNEVYGIFVDFHVKSGEEAKYTRTL